MARNWYFHLFLIFLQSVIIESKNSENLINVGHTKSETFVNIIGFKFYEKHHCMFKRLIKSENVDSSTMNKNNFNIANAKEMCEKFNATLLQISQRAYYEEVINSADVQSLNSSPVYIPLGIEEQTIMPYQENDDARFQEYFTKNLTWKITWGSGRTSVLNTLSKISIWDTLRWEESDFDGITMLLLGWTRWRTFSKEKDDYENKPELVCIHYQENNNADETFDLCEGKSQKISKYAKVLINEKSHCIFYPPADDIFIKNKYPITYSIPSLQTLQDRCALYKSTVLEILDIEAYEVITKKLAKFESSSFVWIPLGVVKKELISGKVHESRRRDSIDIFWDNGDRTYFGIFVNHGYALRDQDEVVLWNVEDENGTTFLKLPDGTVHLRNPSTINNGSIEIWCHLEQAKGTKCSQMINITFFQTITEQVSFGSATVSTSEINTEPASFQSAITVSMSEVTVTDPNVFINIESTPDCACATTYNTIVIFIFFLMNMVNEIF